MEFLTNKYEKPSESISVWIKEVESSGFCSFAYDAEALDTIANNNSKVPLVVDDNKEDVFVVQDPFCTIDESNVVRYEREDGLDENAGLKGDCSVFLKCGYELNGSWRKGKRHGAGLICGPPLEAKGIKVIWGKYVGGFLTGKARVSLLNVDCTLEGEFVNGKLHGPVRGITSKGRLAWAGLFKAGKSYGASWRGLDGGGFLYGSMGSNGQFTGNKNAYIYPDMTTAFYGRFHDGRMVETQPVEVCETYLDKSGTILRLCFGKPKYQAPTYRFWPSGLNFVSVPPLQEDPFEVKHVYVGKSKMSEHAGDGLFVRHDVPANTTICFYNGIRVKPGEKAPYENGGYQIFVDWNKKSAITSDYMDIPPDYVSVKRYKASIGHKINHSFDPNCRWGVIEHPTFGRVPRVVTIKNLKADEELSCHYMIDMGAAAAEDAKCSWYVELWEEFSKVKKARQTEELMDIAEDQDSSDANYAYSEHLIFTKKENTMHD